MNKLLNIVKHRSNFAEVSYWLLFIFCILFKCMYFQFSTKLNTRPYLSSVNITMILSSFAVVLMLSSLIAFIFNKHRFIALFVFNLLLTILLMADTNFFRYYYNLLTVPVFFQMDVKLLSSVDQSIMSLFLLKDIVYIIDIPFMLAGLILLHKNTEKLYFKKRALRSVCLFLVGLISFMSIVSTTNVNSLAYSSNYSAKSLGVFYSHYHNTKLFVKESILEDSTLTQEDQDRINEFYKNKAANSTRNKLNGISKDTNLIIVQMEAIQHFVINRKIGGKEITPNLNKFAKECLYFDNIYYQVSGGNTSDAEFLCNTSMYPTKEGSIYHRFPENKYPSLPATLKEEGYNAFSFHAFEKYFWNREEMHANLKFDRFYSSEDFIMDDFAGWDGQALSDSSFFKQYLGILDTSKPFYSFLVTLSSHHPFKYFEDYDFPVGEFEGTFVGNYLKSANYLDKCIGEFISELKETGLYDNSLLVFYGDHSAVPKVDSKELMQLLDIEYNNTDWIKLQKIPLMMRYPKQTKPEVINTIGGQIDILPTIANLMDLDTPFAFGKDLLNTNKSYAILRNGSVVTEDFIYLSDMKEVYDYSDGSLLDLNVYKNKITQYLNELSICDIIVNKDAFRYMTPDHKH
ncbi:MAG: LTA synthase family protein [Clostridium sp.]|nr:LTA synthase family protein [Clostridium sp.]